MNHTYVQHVLPVSAPQASVYDMYDMTSLVADELAAATALGLYVVGGGGAWSWDRACAGLCWAKLQWCRPCSGAVVQWCRRTTDRGLSRCVIALHQQPSVGSQVSTG